MNTTKTKYLAVGVALALTFGLSACSSGDPETPATEVVVDQDQSGIAQDEDVETAAGNIFVSEEDGFEIAFPGNPDIDEWEEADSGITYAGTNYFFEDEDGSYAVMVTDVTVGERDEFNAQAGVEGSILTMAESTGGVEVSTNIDETFLGMPSGSAHVKVDRNGTTKDLFTQVSIRGTTIFQISTIGLDEHKYDEFVNSFALLD